MSTIAFIGLGNMGIGMATNLAKAGHEVRALDISKEAIARELHARLWHCLLYTSPSPRDRQKSRMPSSA